MGDSESAGADGARPPGSGGSSGVPEHGPQLHRALVAATTGIDAVEDRLSTLFARTDGDSTASSGSSVPLQVRPDQDVVDDDVRLRHDETAAAFAELDAALASEEPDEPNPARRTFFRRRR